VLYLLALVFAALGLFLFIKAEQRRRKAGLPRGRLISSDVGVWGEVQQPLYDPNLGLTGKPDYLVKSSEAFIPVEVKSSRAPVAPYEAHIYQLAAYCLLVETHYGQRPPYGILRYADRTFAVDYTPELEQALLEVMEQMRGLERRTAPRSHTEPARCVRCGYRKGCDERL
jgi:CRISPR-associated exonuclease Cas4